MLNKLAISLGSICLTACFQSGLHAAEDKPIVALSEQTAGEDYPFQGEYSGTIISDDGDVKLGVQVIAEGKGAFKVVAFPGGLPGDGWIGNEKFEATGRHEGDRVLLTGDQGDGVITEGQLIVSSSSGETLGTLKKVMRKSPTLGAQPPEGAVVLFDGKSADNFENGKITEDGLLMQGTRSKETFQSGTLHLEFMLSFMPEGRGQGRANSGCYLQGRYEVQILDSFGLSGEHNECGGIYTVSKPGVNMCFPPLSWQTYDIEFTQARFDAGGKKVKNARATVRHNGVLVHKDVEIDHATTASILKESPAPGPVYLQDHGNPIRYRNIWFVPQQ